VAARQEKPRVFDRRFIARKGYIDSAQNVAVRIKKIKAIVGHDGAYLHAAMQDRGGLPERGRDSVFNYTTQTLCYAMRLKYIIFAL